MEVTKEKIEAAEFMVAGPAIVQRMMESVDFTPVNQYPVGLGVMEREVGYYAPLAARVVGQPEISREWPAAPAS